MPGRPGGGSFRRTYQAPSRGPSTARMRVSVRERARAQYGPGPSPPSGGGAPEAPLPIASSELGRIGYGRPVDVRVPECCRAVLLNRRLGHVAACLERHPVVVDGRAVLRVANVVPHERGVVVRGARVHVVAEEL